MLNMTGIEEIVKYQQELLNHQRNQKLIQKETIKLLNALNKNITFMSDRLDEFALKTNIKLDNNLCPTNTSHFSNQINVNTLQELNNVNTTDPYFTNSYYDTQLNNQTVNNLIAGTTNLGSTTTAMPVTNQTISLNEDIKEYYILSDCNIEPLPVSQTPVVQQQIIQNGQLVQQPQQLVLIQNDNLPTNSHIAKSNTNKSISNNNISLNKIKSSPIKINSSRTGMSIKISDVTNSTGVNTTTTSDESLDDEMSLEESSEDEKETIQIRKKPKTSFSTIQTNSSKSKEYEESHNQQRLFNKYVRENVENRLGKEFLLLHEIQEIDHDVMETIKKDALEMYPPINIRPRRAWHLAKASLRCRRRSLRRQKEKLMSSSIDQSSILDSNHQNHTASNEDSPVQTMITMTNL